WHQLPSSPGQSIRCTGAAITAGIGGGGTTGAIAGGKPAGGRVEPRPALLGHTRCTRSLTPQRADKACACVGEADPARLEHATREEKAGQLKAVGDVLGRRITAARLAQASRKNYQLFVPRSPRLPRYRASRFRRYIDEISFYSTRRAGRKIESETELRQKTQLETHRVGRGAAWIDEPVEQVHECGMNLRMRVALRQQPAERGGICHPVKRVRDRSKLCPAP